jgi:hypothetical protein
MSDSTSQLADAMPKIAESKAGFFLTRLSRISTIFFESDTIGNAIVAESESLRIVDYFTIVVASLMLFKRVDASF